MVPNSIDMVRLLGAGDEILKLVERPSRATCTCGATRSPHRRGRGQRLVERIFSELIELVRKGEILTPDNVRRTVGIQQAEHDRAPRRRADPQHPPPRGRTIRPKTLGQKRYVDSIDQHTIVFGIGPAGTGKTYLAMAKAGRRCRPSRSSGSS